MTFENSEVKPAIVIDLGSGWIKAGFAGDDAPLAVFPAIIGRRKREKAMTEDKEYYIGYDAQHKRGILEITHPIEHGIIQDWSDFEIMLSYLFDQQLRINSADQFVLVTEAPDNPKANRERMVELLFDAFNVAGVYVQVSGVLGLYATGRSTGLVVDVGDSVTYSTPVFEGCMIRNAINRLHVAGRDVTTVFQRKLAEEGVPLDTTARFEILLPMKESLCYCAESVVSEGEKDVARTFNLPDGSVISVGRSRYHAAETLFNPEQYLDLEPGESDGIHKKVIKSIYSSDKEIRSALVQNIVLVGGTTLLGGFTERLETELRNFSAQIRVFSPPERRWSQWIGGSILASLNSFQSMMISRDEYEELVEIFEAIPPTEIELAEIESNLVKVHL